MTRKKRKKGKGCLTVLLCILAAALCVTGFIALRTQLVYKKLTKPAVTEAAIRPSVDFVQPGMLAGWTDEQYAEYFGLLRGAGYDSVILQFTRYKVGGVCYTYYPSAGMKDRYETVDDSMSDVLGALLANAAREGFEVWVGLSVDDDDWWGVLCTWDEDWMRALGEVDVMMIREISELYGDEPAFRGWYWAHELYSNPVRMEAIWAELLNSAIAAIDQTADGRPLMLSPFRHVQTGLVTNEYRMWRRFFDAVNFREGDIFAPQDSTGKLNQSHPDEPSRFSAVVIYDYLNAVKRAVDETPELSLWINVELFQKENGDEYNAADAARVKLQCANASRVTDTLVSFSFSHYALPMGTNDTPEGRAALFEGMTK